MAKVLPDPVFINMVIHGDYAFEFTPLRPHSLLYVEEENVEAKPSLGVQGTLIPERGRLLGMKTRSVTYRCTNMI